MKKLNRGYLLTNPRAILLLRIVDGLGAALFSLKKKRGPPADTRRILVAKIDHLGDVLMSLHALPALKRDFPNARVHFVCGRWARDLVAGNPRIDRVFFYDDFRLVRSGGLWTRLVRSARDAAALLRAMLRERYDLALDFRSYYPNGLPLLALGSPRCLAGFPTGGFGFLLDRAAAWREGVHETEHFFDLLGTVSPEGRAQDREDPGLGYLEDAPACEAFLDSIGAAGGGRLVLVHAFCRRSFLSGMKHWRTEEWKKVVRGILESGRTVLCTGDADDAPLVEELAAGTGAKNVAGKTSLAVLSGLIRRAELCLTIDTFFSHLAAGLGARTVVIFNDAEPVRQWGPWGERVSTLPIDCSARDMMEKAGIGSHA